jgi:hypothetical protein
MIVDEIEAACRTLALEDADFRRLPELEAKRIYEQVEAHFVGSQGKNGWWGNFRQPAARANFLDQHGYERITQIAPDAARAYLIPEPGGQGWPPVYACSVRAAQQLLGECYAFEYYLVAEDRQWLIGENKHGVMTAIGEPVERRLRALAS